MLTDAELSAVKACLPPDPTYEEMLLLIRAAYSLRQYRTLPVLPPLVRPSLSQLAETETK